MKPKPSRAAPLPLRQLRIAGWVAVGFASFAGLLLSWERLFPAAPYKQIEVRWTHECPCAGAWMASLREQGFVVRDFELTELNATRRLWHVPDVARGCHPARFMGYVLDGHVPGPLLSRLARERPAAVALLQARTANPDELRFELLAADGSSRAWP